MANISNRLKGLFNDYLNRLEEEKKRPYGSAVHNPYYGCCARPPMITPHQQRINFGSDDNDFKGVIYFYEWSDSKRIPKSFYTLTAFEDFLNRSNIFMASYQRELIIHISTPYVACKKDGHELLIKTNYDALKNALEEDEKPKGSEEKEPYNVSITRTPHGIQTPIQRPKTYEPESRWDEMHPEVGGCWGW